MASTIICATTESKSRKSKKSTIKSVMEIFQNSEFDFLYGPANHNERTPSKHNMALTQAIHARQTNSHVHLILIVPNEHKYDHMGELSKKAEENGVDLTITTVGILEFIRQVAFHRFQRQKWDMSPDPV